MNTRAAKTIGQIVDLNHSKGETLLRVHIPTNTIVPVRFSIRAGQKLSWFNVHRELSGVGNAPLEATLSSNPAIGNDIAHAAGRSMGSNQPHFLHSDAGVGALNLAPNANYYYLIETSDGSARDVEIGYQDGG